MQMGFGARMSDSGRGHRRRSEEHKRALFRLELESEDDERGKRWKVPELYSIHKARVQSVQPFGLFVRLQGFEKEGLVHLSQLSEHEVASRDAGDDVKVEAISGIADKGEEVWVKVISVKEEEEDGKLKIGCSLKYVSQSTGQDLDPNNVQLEQNRAAPNRPDPRKVTLEAVYNVVCSRCGGHGHLKTECYAIGDKSYELLPENDDLEKAAYDRGESPQMAQDFMPDTRKHRRRKTSKQDNLPDRVTTVEEALSVIAKHKKEKRESKKTGSGELRRMTRSFIEKLKRIIEKGKRVIRKTEIENMLQGSTSLIFL